MYSIGTSGTGFTKLGEQLAKDLPGKKQDWISDRLFLNMSCDFSSIRKGSPHLKKQREWINVMMDRIENDFDWTIIKPDLQKAYVL